MKVFYSHKTKGFYQTDIHDVIPQDSVEIEDKYRWALLEGQSQGKVISADESGFPILTEKVVTPEDIAQTERVWRNKELIRADIELYKAQDADPKASGTVAQWRDYRKKLRAWPEQAEFPDVNFRPKSPDKE